MAVPRRALLVVVGWLGIASAARADLVAYWSFNEGSGTVANDTAGPFFSNGTLLAGSPEPLPSWVAGHTGAAGDFSLHFANGNASGAYTGSARVLVGNPAELQTTGSTTWMMWLRPTGTPGEGRQNPWNKAYGGEGTWTIEPNGGINLYYGQGGGDNAPHANRQSAAGVLTTNTWAHAAVVRNLNGVPGVQAADTVSWYINAALSGGVQVAPFDPAVAGGQSVFIGTGYTNGFLGQIDDVAVWNEALTAGQIAAIYRKSLPGSPIGPGGLNLDLVDIDALFDIYRGGPGTEGQFGPYELSYVSGFDTSGFLLGDAIPTPSGFFLFLEAGTNVGVLAEIPPLAPEPGTLALFAVAAAGGLGVRTWRRRRAG